MAFLSTTALSTLGLGSVGEDVLIDEQVVFHGAEYISIGHRTRIDAQVIVSAGPGTVEIGNNVHIAAGCYLFGGGAGISLGHYSGFSSRVSVYSSSDDYTEGYLSNPTVPAEFRKLRERRVTLGDHALVGSASVLLPGAELGVGATVGALSVVSRPVGAFVLAAGNPLKDLRTRSADLTKSLRAEYEQRLSAEDRPV